MWPFASLALTGPYILARLIAHRRVTWPYVFASYLLALYSLGLLFFTLYPMPDDPAVFCADHTLSPQLLPFHWVVDIAQQTHRLQVTLQLIANIIFFVPLGIFVAVYSKKRLLVAVIAGLGVSFLIEIMQLTGMFGLYPCSFRLFDVDDLMANTLGSAIGYLLARRIGYRIRAQKLSAPQPVRPTFSRWLLVIGIDVFILLLLVELSAIFISLAHLTESIDAPYVFLFWGTLYFGIIPLFARRYRTLGRYLVGIQRNRRPR